MITIKEVKTRKEIRDFINLPLKMYKDNPYFAPPLYIDELKIFKKNNVYSDQCESVFFNAYDGKKIVGRIQGILQKVANQKNNEKRIRFTRFDAVDNQEVADKLFKALENWALKMGMDTVCGPLGFSDLDREGLLIEGFNELSTFEEQYNFPYYQKLIENCGYEKEVDWLEFKLRAPKERNEKLTRISNYMLKRYNLHYGTAKSARKFINKYKDQLFEILDLAYDNLYGTVPITEKMKKMMISNFKLIINPKDVAVILDENEKMVCFGICFPSITKAVQKSSGHLTIPCLIRLIKAIKHPKIIDLGLIGVLPEYQRRGIASSVIDNIINILSDSDILYAETNLNLETNANITNNWKNFDNEQHKRRRAFVKVLK